MFIDPGQSSHSRMSINCHRLSDFPDTAITLGMRLCRTKVRSDNRGTLEFHNPPFSGIVADPFLLILTY